jgi:DNA-directed RNA polymerase specialized sigma subunit
MNAKEYLEQYRSIRLKMVQLNDRILSIETEVASYHPRQLDDSGASHLNYREDKIIKAMTRIESLEEKKGRLLLKADEIKENIGKVEDPLESMVLWLRYIEPHPNKSYAPLGWREIGKRINYSQEGAKKIHTRALKHFSEKCTES